MPKSVPDSYGVKVPSPECFKQMLDALKAAEAYMRRQRAKSNAPFDPEALKAVRAAIYQAERQ
jgi:hypothetical protein